MVHHPDHHAHYGRDDAHEDDARNEQTGVTVADMGKFMGQLVIVEKLEKTGGNGHCIAALADATCKSVELGIINDIDFGHVHATGHTEILHDVIDSGILPTRQGASSRGLLDHGGVGKIGNEEPCAHPEDYPGDGGKEIAIDHLYVKLVDHIAMGIIIIGAKIIDQGQENPYRAEDDEREHQEQQHAQHIVAPDLGIHSNVFHAV